MDIVDLRIDQPSHEQVFVGTGDVTLRGQVLSTRHEPAPLFFKWYSSIDGELSTANQAALTVGSHIITFTAQDKSDAGVPDEQLVALYQSIQHIGMAGGPPEVAEVPCVVHVFIANMLAPVPIGPPPPLSREDPILEAQVPLQWANYDPSSKTYDGLNPDYHKVNRIRYRWFLRRVGSPPGPLIELDLQDGDALQFIPSSDAPGEEVPKLRYIETLPLPDTAVGESYSVTLRVEDLDDSTIGHQATREVTIAA
jgi:hypothetical protein